MVGNKMAVNVFRNTAFRLLSICAERSLEICFQRFVVRLELAFNFHNLWLP